MADNMRNDSQRNGRRAQDVRRLGMVAALLAAVVLSVAAMSATVPSTLAAGAHPTTAVATGTVDASGEMVPMDEDVLVEEVVSEMLIDALPADARQEELDFAAAESGLMLSAESVRDEIEDGSVAALTYDAMLPHARNLATGVETSTQIPFEPTDVLGEKLTWNGSELGINFATATADEIQEALKNKVAEIGVFRGESALMADYPQYFYWFDKAWTYGYSFGYSYVTGANGYATIGSFTIVMTVSPNYRASASDKYHIKANITDQVGGAIAKAKQVADAHRAEFPAQRVQSYVDEIGTLVDYNHDAASWNWDGIALSSDPWQIIWVFDSDPDTKVVCEGYGKALKYLCDLSGRTDIECRTVTGYMNTQSSDGLHMWDVIRMDDGHSYMVDPTNCDSGSAGYPDYLCLKKPLPHNASGWYAFTTQSQSGTTRYLYDDDTQAMHSAEFLDLYMGDYVAPARSLADATITLEYDVTTYDGTAHEPSVVVNYKGLDLTQGTDFTVTYSDNVDAGAGAVIVTAPAGSDYVGRKVTTFEIQRMPVTVTAHDMTVTYGHDYGFASAEKVPADAPVTYSPTVTVAGDQPVGTYPGAVGFDNPEEVQGNYFVTFVPGTLTVERLNLSELAFDEIPEQEWTGSTIEPSPTARLAAFGNKVIPSSNFYLSYSQNTCVGTATISIVGTANCTGSASVTFDIVPRQVAKPTAIAGLVYNGTEQTGVPASATGDYILSGTPSATNASGAGYPYTATATLTHPEGTTWSDGTTEPATVLWVISPASVSFTIDAIPDQPYWPGDIKPEVSVTCVPEIEYEVVYGTVAYYASSYSSNAIGEGSVSVKPASDNYVGGASASFSVVKRPIGIDVNDAEKEYGEDDPQFSASVSGIPEGEELPLTFNRAEGEEPDEYTVSASPTDNPERYKYRSGTISGGYLHNGRLFITKAHPAITIADVTDELTYDGTGKEPTPSVTVATVNGEVQPAFSYSYQNNVHAGEDTATVTVTISADDPHYQGSASKAFSIGKRSATVTADDKTKEYGQPDPKLTATVHEGDLIGDDTLAYSLTRAEGSVPGEYAIHVIPGENADYEITPVDGTLTITKVPIAPPVPTPLTYDGTEQTGLSAPADCGYVLTGTTSATDAGTYTAIATLVSENLEWDDETTAPKTIQWTISPAQVTFAIGAIDDQPWWPYDGGIRPVPSVTSDPEVEYEVAYEGNTALGTATVTVTPTSANYAGEGTQTFSIVKRSLSIAVDNASKAYGADDPAYTATISGCPDGETLPLTFTRSDAGTTVGEALGPHSVTAEPAENPAYYDLSVTPGTLTITQASATVTISPVTESYSYDKTAHEPTPTVTTVPADLPVVYTYADNVNAGAATVTASIDPDGNPNYAGSASTTFQIAKREAQVTADDKTKAYGESDPELTATVHEGDLLDGDSLSYNLGRADGDTPGTYAITVTAGTNANYEIVPVAGTLTITRAKVTPPTASSSSLVYDGTDQTGVLAPDGCGYTLSGTYHATDAGTYVAIASLADANHEWDDGSTGSVSVEWTIASMSVTFQISDIADKQWWSWEGGVRPEPTVTSNPAGIEYDATYDNNMAPGTATVIVSPKSTNYSGYASKDFTITKRSLTIAVSSETKAYGTDDPAFTATVSGCPNGEEVDLTFIRPDKDDENGEALGPHSVTAQPTTHPEYYDLTVTPGTLTIVPAAAPVEVSDVTGAYSYDGTEHRPEPTVTTVPAELPVIYTYSNNVHAGTATVTATIDTTQNPDYVGSGSTTFTIGKRTATVTADDKTKAFGEADPEFTATVHEGDLIGDDTLAYAFSRAAGTTPGTYAINVVPGTNADYEITPVAGTLTITRAKVTPPTAPTDEIEYDGTKKVGITAPDGCGYTLSGTYEATNAGTYVATATLADANHEWDDGTTDPKDVAWTILPMDVTFEIADIADQPWWPQEGGIRPAVSVTSDPAGVGYAVSYFDNEDVGQATATVLPTSGNYSGGTNRTFNIVKRPLTITVNDASKAFGEADPEYSATIAGCPDGETLPLTFTRTDAGTQEGEATGSHATVTAAPTEHPERYDVTVNPGTLTITAASATVTVSPVTETFTYDGTEHKPEPTVTTVPADLPVKYAYEANIHAGTATVTAMIDTDACADYSGSGSATFAIGKRAITVTANDDGKVYGQTDPATLTATVGTGLLAGDSLAYDVEREEGDDAGTYAINVVPGTNADYEITPVAGTFTISPATVTTPVAPAQPFTYDGTTKVGLAESGTGAYTVSGTPSATDANTDGQTYSATATLASGNYVWDDGTTAPKTITWSIAPATVTFQIASIPDQPYQEGGVTPTLSVTSDPSGVAWEPAWQNNTTIGTASVTVSSADTNYVGTSDPREFQVVKRGLTVIVNDATKTYGDDDPTFTATVTDDGQPVNVELSFSREEGDDVGTYEITAALSDPDSPYAIAVTPGTLTITPRTVTLTVAPVLAQTYTGQPICPTPTVTTSPVEGVATSLAWAANTDVGTHAQVIASVADPKGNYVGTPVTREFVILPCPVTITPDDKEKTYGDADPELTATVTGLPDGITVGDGFIYSLGRQPGSDAGTYAIYATHDNGANFAVTVADAKLTINPKPVTFQIGEMGPYQYDGTKQSPRPTSITCSDPAALESKTEAWSGTRQHAGDTGTYTVTAAGNWSGTASQGFTISKRPATVRANDLTLEYGKTANPSLTASVGGTVAGDTLSYTLACDVTATSPIADYPITVTLGDNPDYDVTPTNGTLHVVESVVQLHIANIPTQTFTGLAIEPTLTVTPADVPYDATWDNNVNAGTATVTINAKGGYAGTATKTFTIAKAPATISIANASKTYGEPDPEFSATVTGNLDAAPFSYQLTRTTGSDAGTYAIDATITGGDNYRITVNRGRLTINPAPATLTVGTIEPRTYTGYAQSPVPTVTTSPEGVQYDLVYSNNKNVGTATVRAVAKGNYSGEGTGSFSITKAQATVAANDASKMAGNADPTLTATVRGTLGGDTLNYTVTRESGEDVGTYAMSVVLGSNPNYDVDTQGATFTITKIRFNDVGTYTPHSGDIDWLADNGISTGWPSGNAREFRPSQDIIRADMAAFLFRLGVKAGIVSNDWQPSSGIRSRFVDVNDSTPHAREIWWLAESGISKGWPSGNRYEFRPYAKIIRQDMAAFLMRLAVKEGKARDSWSPQGSDMSAFSDVNSSTPHCREIWWLAKVGISRGWNEGGWVTFRGMNTVLRQDMAAFLHRLDSLP